jgi:hypothetical protein
VILHDCAYQSYLNHPAHPPVMLAYQLTLSAAQSFEII